MSPPPETTLPTSSGTAVQRTLFDVSHSDLADLLTAIDPKMPRFRLEQIWEGIYRHGRSPLEISNLPTSLRTALDEALPAALDPAAESSDDRGETIKFLWRLHDGALIETVLMLYRDRATVCISSQAGCAMACGFCATGQAGFRRHLSVGEIVEQVVRASRRARDLGRRVSNVVFMGMGEPLVNEAAVWTAVERFHGDLGLSARHLTISTVGIVPGIRALAGRSLPVNLAVSLHAANDRLRDELVPINRRYPIDDLIGACREYLASTRRRISFEWAMIDGVNDRPTDAAELADLCHRLRPRAHVNLIPLNPTPGYDTRGTPLARVHEFRDDLESLGVTATVRKNRGTDIDAACGQLAARQPVEIRPRP